MEHTNKNLYFKNTVINKRVGGLQKKQGSQQNEEDYISQQINILNDQNQKLYPNIRYEKPPYDTYSSQKNKISNPYQSGQTYHNDSNTQNSTNNKPNKDIYLNGMQDRYDPYVGYLYDRGLIPDAEQRRRLITNYIDINSAFRIKNAVINVDVEYALPPNPLTFTDGSNILHISVDPNNFNVNDPITLTNVVSRFSILRTIRGTLNGSALYTFEIKPGFNFMKIWYDHHIPLSYTGETIQIIISGIIGNQLTVNMVPTFLGNVPVSTINTTHQVQLSVTQTDISGTETITSSSTNNILNITNNDPNYFTPSPEYFFIMLPIGLQSSSSYTVTDYNFNLGFLSLEGIPLNVINTSSQINPNQLTSFHIIQSIDDTGINILLSNNAITDTDALNNVTSTINSGGNFIIIGHVSEIINGYPDPNSYTVTLPEVYHNVVSIKLHSSEIPNANKTIRDYPTESANNKLYWNDLDDGDYLYSISIPSGNYTPDSLIVALTAAFATTPRINSDPETVAALNIKYTATHFIQTTININTSEVVFEPYKEFVLDQPISDIIIDSSGRYTLVIHQENHGAKVGQAILIQNAIADTGIPASIINGTQAVATVIDLNYYTVNLAKFNVIADTTTTGGGINVFIYVPDTIRFRFDQPNTLGTVLGFRNPGEPLSITPYSSSISNAKPYAQELTINSLGQQINITNNSLQMAGDNYVIMTAEPIRVFESISAIKNAFAKITLCDSPGKVLYNSFVNMTQLYENPISSLNQLSIGFYTPDGALVNFDGLEHSFTLEIITVSDIPNETRINANTGKNYNQAV